MVEGLDEVPGFVLLAGGVGRDLLVLKTSGSRVAVSSEWYSILSLPVRTYLGISVGSTLSVNSLQIGHSRSPKYFNVTGALGSPSVLPLWGMPLISVFISSPSRSIVRAPRRRPFCCAAAGGDRDPDDHDDDDRDDDPELRQARAPFRAIGLGLLERLAFAARLLTTLLAREIPIVILGSRTHRPTFYTFLLKPG